MVSREKVLERKLARLEALLNVIEATAVVELPVSYIVALFRGFNLSVLAGIVVTYLVLGIVYGIFRRIYDKIFEEWSRDPPMRRRLDPHDLLMIICPIAAIVIMLIVWLL